MPEYHEEPTEVRQRVMRAIHNARMPVTMSQLKLAFPDVDNLGSVISDLIEAGEVRFVGNATRGIYRGDALYF